MNFPEGPTNEETKYQKLTSMSIVGHTTAHSCRLWVRVYRSGTWWLVVSEQPLTGDLDSLNGLQVSDYLIDQSIAASYVEPKYISNATDLTHVFDITGLKKNTRYYYALIADIKHKNTILRRTEIGNQEKKYFKTLPEQASRVVFGFYSCHDPFSNASHGQGAWPNLYDVLCDQQAMFVIGGGDQIYVDANDKEDMYSIWEWLAQYKNPIIKKYSDNNGLQKDALVQYFRKIYRNYYRIYWNFFSLQKVYESFPQYMIWDDHEIMDGWGSYTNQERKKLLNKLFQDDDEDTNGELIQLMFQAAKLVYFEYQHQHNPTTEIFLQTLKPMRFVNGITTLMLAVFIFMF